jgi:hypothetical protein
MGKRHRWEMTLREFMEIARHDYGLEMEVPPILGTMVFEKLHEQIYFAAKLGMDDVLPPSLLRSLCSFYGLPPLDFGLDPEGE